MSCRHSLWTHVNLVLLSLLQIDWFVNPSLCLLNDDQVSVLVQCKENVVCWFYSCEEDNNTELVYTARVEKHIGSISLLQIVTYECTTAQVNGAKPLTIDAWQCFLFDIRDCIKEWLVFFLSLHLSLPFDWTLRYWVCVCCFVLLYFGCYYVWKKKMLMIKNVSW